MKILLTVLTLLTASSSGAAELCSKVERLVESKGVSEPESAFAPHNVKTAYLSKSLMPRVWGFYSEWMDRSVRVEYLIFKDLALSDWTLRYTVSLERNAFPLKAVGEVAWEKRDTLPLGGSAVYRSRINQRDYRATVTFTREPDAAFCAPPPR